MGGGRQQHFRQLGALPPLPCGLEMLFLYFLMLLLYSSTLCFLLFVCSRRVRAIPQFLLHPWLDLGLVDRLDTQVQVCRVVQASLPGSRMLSSQLGREW